MADVARRYAMALFAALPGKAERELASQALQAAASYLASSPEARAFLSDPEKGWDERARAFEIIARAGIAADAPQGEAVARTVASALSVLLRRGRIGLLGPVSEAFRLMADESSRTLRARVETASPLEEGERKNLTLALSSRFSIPDVILEERVDPSLLGGFRVRIGDIALDGSLKGRLDRLRRFTLQEDRSWL